VAGAYWNLFTSTPVGTCCELLSITGIAGVTLIGGQPYFMVLKPQSLSDFSDIVWYGNNPGPGLPIGVTGVLLFSLDGGSTWIHNVRTLPAFDVLSAPEPETMVMLVSGLLALSVFGKRRRQT
jgi:hypothetical protein